MRTHFLYPSSRLDSFVEAYVDFRLRAGEVELWQHRLLPAPGTSMAIGYDGSRARVQVEGYAEAEVPLCSISGYWTAPKTYRMAPPGGVFVVCFTPWGLSRLTRLPVGELTNRNVEIAHAFGAAVQDELSDRVARCRGAGERKDVVEEILVRLLAADRGAQSREAAAERAVELIAGSGGTIRVEDLADAFGFGRRRLDRMFTSEIGYSPKKIARLIRFQRALKVLPRVATLTEAAYELGYYDQAHFIREFRELSGRTPGAYLRTTTPTDLGQAFSAVIRSSHLYNTVYE